MTSPECVHCAASTRATEPDDGIATLLDVLDRMFPQIGDDVTVQTDALPVLTGVFGGVMLTEAGVPSCVRLDVTQSGLDGGDVLALLTIPWPCTITRLGKP